MQATKSQQAGERTHAEKMDEAIENTWPKQKFHTPGPWGVSKTAAGIPLPSVHHKNGCICELNPAPELNNANEAFAQNALLIAAAPDLLAACTEGLKFCKERGGRWSEFEDVLTAVIRKATTL